MPLRNFFYRQKSRLQYHTAQDDIGRTIAEINRHRKRIASMGNSYSIPEASLIVPKGSIDHLFSRFDLLIDNMVNLKGHYVWQEEMLYFSFDDLSIRIISANELFIINEIFFHNCYNYKTSDDAQYNVIDIGMNVGLASLFFAGKRSVNKIFAYEPVYESYAQALDNFSINQHLSNKIEAFNFGLGNGARMQNILYDPMASGTSGFRADATAKDKNAGERSVRIENAFITLNNIIHGYSEYPYLLKIDCEGAEYEIIDCLVESGLHRQIQTIVMEWHGTTAGQIASRLSQAGMKMFFTRFRNNLGLIYAFR